MRGVDAQQIFMTATLMCVVWLTTLTMLVRQARFTDFAANKASLVSGHGCTPHSTVKRAQSLMLNSQTPHAWLPGFEQPKEHGRRVIASSTLPAISARPQAG